MPQQSRKVWGGVLLMLLTAFTVAAQARVTQEFHKTVPLGSNGGFSLKNINGAAHISAWDRNEVQVDAIKSADEQRKLDEAQIEVSTFGSNVEVETKYPEHRNQHNPASVEYTIHVPRGAKLDQISLVNGNLEIEGFTSYIHAESVNGNLRISNVTGTLKAQSVNGRLEASFNTLGADSIKLETVNGALELRLPATANAHLHANTVNGSVQSDFALAVEHSKFGPGSRMDGNIGSGTTKVDLSTVNGSIKVSRI